MYVYKTISKIIFHCTKCATKYLLDYLTLTKESI